MSAAQAASGASSGLLLPSGKILAGGRTDLGSLTHKGYFALARYNANGSLDTSFGRKGKIATPLGVHFGAGMNALVRQPDGKIVAGGSSYNGHNFDFALVRYKPSGAVDTSFGHDGKVTTNFFGGDSISGLALQPNGMIVAVGVAGIVGADGNSGNFALARYKANGLLDQSFGSGGKVQTKIGAVSGASSVVLQPDGKIVVAGSGLARYNSDGSLDPSFGSGGIVTTPPGVVASLALEPDGKIVVAGSSILRYLPDGSLDPSFGSGGQVSLTRNFFGKAVLIQPDGKIVVAGRVGGGGGTLAVARLQQDGSLDSGFGSGGMVVTGFGIAYSEANALARTVGGKLLVAGDSGAGKNLIVGRYNSDGSLDPSFGTGGKVTTSFTVCAVPTLKGKKLSGAKLALKNARCSVGKVSGRGRVVSQSRPAGTWLKVGTKVSIRLR